MAALAQRGQVGTGLTRRITRALWFDTLRLPSLPPKQNTNHNGSKANMRGIETYQ
jgi:hypothetical protein